MRDSERIDCQSWREHISACESSLLFCWCTLYLQHSLQLRAGGFFVLIEGVGSRYPAWRRAGCGRGYPLPLPYPHRPRSSAGSGVAQAVDIELLSVDIPPLQGAALAAPHPRGNDKLEVCLILDALIFQCSDDFLRRFFVGNLFPCFLTCVARHGSGDRTPISMEYVSCCELRVSFMAGRLALPRLALEEEIDVPITGNVLSGNGFPVMSRFG